MQIAVISDVHSNLEALTAVFEDVRRFQLDGVWCMGDIIGYGADPLPCMDLILERCNLVLAGNHDWASVGLMDTARFNPFAKRSTEWTRQQLRDGDMSFIRSIPLIAATESLLAVHGSMTEPAMFHYLQTYSEAMANFQIMEELDVSIMLCGHTHNPIVFLDTNPMTYTSEEVVFLDEDVAALVNVGSVGQPRDGDPRACYCIVDTAKRLIRYRRVEYNADAARAKVDALFPDISRKDEPLPGYEEKDHDKNNDGVVDKT
jgi:diadenosine tetraphosphatase ApaH/serine/threonine PP2A family protein phosphatase